MVKDDSKENMNVNIFLPALCWFSEFEAIRSGIHLKSEELVWQKCKEGVLANLPPSSLSILLRLKGNPCFLSALSSTALDALPQRSPAW